MMKDKLTIILAVRDRHEFVERWLRFMDFEKCSYKIIIADGSISSMHKSIFDNRIYENINFEYIKFLPDQNYSMYHKKISEALSYVKTPYVLMADDDDFYCLDGIKASIDFLDANADYVSCRGSYQGFEVEAVELLHESDQVYGDVKLYGEIYPSLSISELLARKRVQRYFANWNPNWYNIQRAEVFEKCWNSVTELNLENIFLFEHALGAKVAAEGKVFADDYPYYFRQVKGKYITSSQTAKEINGDWFDQMFAETWSVDYKSFINLIANDIKDDSHDAMENAKKITHMAYRRFHEPAVASVISESRVGVRAGLYSIYKMVDRVLIFLCRLPNLRKKFLLMKAIRSSQCVNDIKLFMAKYRLRSKS